MSLLTFYFQMDYGICIVSSIMGGYDGAHNIWFVELPLQL
jgi:hypothetical protein